MRRKKKTKKTVAQVLNSCSKGDKISDGKRVWKITECSDTIVVASPHKFPKDEDKFELWNCGAESVAFIPNLKKVS